MKTKIYLYLILAFSFFPVLSRGQGCSDAGFCTLDGLTPAEDQSGSHFSIAFTQGRGDNEVNISNLFCEYRLAVQPSFFITAKLSGGYYSGPLGSVTGLSDLYLRLP